MRGHRIESLIDVEVGGQKEPGIQNLVSFTLSADLDLLSGEDDYLYSFLVRRRRLNVDLKRLTVE
jgi:hypothetical protein